MAEEKEEKSVIELKQEEYKAIQAQVANLTQQVQIAQTVVTKEKSRSEELGNLVVRMQADFDNYRKRNNEQMKHNKEDGAVEVVEKLLPVLDDMKRAIMMIQEEQASLASKAAQPAPAASGEAAAAAEGAQPAAPAEKQPADVVKQVGDGVKMIYRKITDMLASINVTEIPALGEQFDPNLHNAIQQVKVKDPTKVNMVVEVYQKGYRMGDRVIRHSVVTVAK